MRMLEALDNLRFEPNDTSARVKRKTLVDEIHVGTCTSTQWCNALDIMIAMKLVK
jgi:hypothetical protein